MGEINNIPGPRVATASAAPLTCLEKIILKNSPIIETWFKEKWQETPPPFTSSVDLRYCGVKIAPVDTNLFPAGFNNLNHEFLPLCVQAVQAVLATEKLESNKILLLPESHTRNHFYIENLKVLRDIFIQAGFIVRLGSLDPLLTENIKFITDSGEVLLIEVLERQQDQLGLIDFTPSLILLNNDLSTGIPLILQGIKQKIIPTPQLGWWHRCKSSHFYFYNIVALEFAKLIDLDSWLINADFRTVDNINFMLGEGFASIVRATDAVLLGIKDKYTFYNISEKPFVVIKADNGTYGMSVMSIQHSTELLKLNRKKRTRMAATKGGHKVKQVLVQEGVYTFETMLGDAVAELVVYLIGQFVVGGFYRFHQDKGRNESLNTPGMHFAPLAFAPPYDQAAKTSNSNMGGRFYVYGVIARLAALAAAMEMAAVRNC